MDESLPPDNMSARSATEVVERMKELAQNLGASFGRLITETMVPIIKRTLMIMDEKGMIEMPLKVNGLEVKVIPVSPLAKAQNMEEVNEAMQLFQMCQALGPGGMSTVKPDAIADFIADKLGVSSNLRTTNEEREMIQQQAMQMAQAQAMQMQGGQGGPPGSPPLEEPASAVANEVGA
jgi:hypothetical protein